MPLDGLWHLVSPRPWLQVVTDLLDLVLVTYVVYRALLVLRGTRAMQMGTGLGVIFLIYVGSRWAGFVTLYNLLSTLLSSIILIVVVVFQNDLRRGLMRVGSRAFFTGMSRQQETRVIDEVVASATELARPRAHHRGRPSRHVQLGDDARTVGKIEAPLRPWLGRELAQMERAVRIHDVAVVEVRGQRVVAGLGLDPDLGALHQQESIRRWLGRDEQRTVIATRAEARDRAARETAQAVRLEPLIVGQGEGCGHGVPGD